MSSKSGDKEKSLSETDRHAMNHGREILNRVKDAIAKRDEKAFQESMNEWNAYKLDSPYMGLDDTEKDELYKMETEIQEILEEIHEEAKKRSEGNATNHPKPNEEPAPQPKPWRPPDRTYNPPSAGYSTGQTKFSYP